MSFSDKQVNIDLKSNIDVTSKLDRNQARKLLSRILNESSDSRISFSKHCREELKNDYLTTVDVFNVLKAGFIKIDPEEVKGTYRYRVETAKITVVVTFPQPDWIRCITAWRK